MGDPPRRLPLNPPEKEGTLFAWFHGTIDAHERQISAISPGLWKNMWLFPSGKPGNSFWIAVSLPSCRI